MSIHYIIQMFLGREFGIRKGVGDEYWGASRVHNAMVISNDAQRRRYEAVEWVIPCARPVHESGLSFKQARL